jgi:putative ABC transport system permease protein
MRWSQRLFRRARTEERLDSELRFHLDQQIANYVAAGMAPEEARRRARLEFGGLDQVKEECREVGAARFIETLIQDLRYGLRQLRRNPGFTTVAVLTLALGIGANTAIFSVVNAVLLRPLPYPSPERIVVVGQRWMGGGGDFSPPDYLDIAAENRVFAQMAAYKDSNFDLTLAHLPERVAGTVVSVGFFRVFGVEPFLGRSFLPSDGGMGVRGVVLSYAVWQAAFGGKEGILGRKISLNEKPYVVLGVMPKGFDFPDGTQIWVAPRFAVPAHPLSPNVNPATMPGAHYFGSVARLRPGITVADARSDVNRVIRLIGEKRPDTEARSGAWIETLHQSQVGNIRPALLALLGAVGLVLLIACANVASLLLARGAARGREMAIRAALGAGRARVARQLLTEGLLLAIFGGGAGVVLAFFGVVPLVNLVPENLQDVVSVSLDGRVLAFAAILVLLAGMLSGLAPVWRGSKTSLTEAFKEGQTSGRLRLAAQNSLVVAETGLALVLLVGAGLLMESFIRLTAVDPGFDSTSVVTLRLSLPASRYPKPGKRSDFVRELLARLAALPGARLASVGTSLPLSGGESRRGVEIEGRPTQPDRIPSILYGVASPEYFRTLGIPLLEGRDFTESDNSNSPGVVIVNRAMADVFWPGTDPLGKRIRFGSEKAWRSVVGVVGDTRQQSLAERAGPMFYAPYAQDSWPFLTVAVRANLNPAGIASEVERAIHGLDPERAIYDVRTMRDEVAGSLLPRRFYMLLFSFFALLALTAVGVFGVTSFAVAQRTHEIGIRMALGAQKADVLEMVVGQGLKLTLIGVAIGIAGPFALTRSLSSLLYGVKPTDPVTFIAVSLILTAVAVLASYIPARQAAQVDPMVALRHE